MAGDAGVACAGLVNASTNSAQMVKIEITTWTGQGWPVVVIADANDQEDEPQVGNRPVLRLIKDGLT